MNTTGRCDVFVLSDSDLAFAMKDASVTFRSERVLECVHAGEYGLFAPGVGHVPGPVVGEISARGEPIAAASEKKTGSIQHGGLSYECEYRVLEDGTFFGKLKVWRPTR